ncbi:calmodulin-dependent protein kinase [Saccharomycopsis crataegensis]|uniref:calcium/calmodulin-dependent protein kinase n=1 Tax=Saccharomycopsis crataegensis TaxID=43959 RepID=A0AAV5QEM7_9ASCO|nr:calmodulin-dependent protein kinase [Saccharomycopsis crataegensis]
MPIVDPDLVQPSPVQGHGIQKFIQKLSGQPTSYARKTNYVFGKTLGAGTFGVVRQARDIATGEDVAMKIILKKTLKGNFNMVYDELKMLQNVQHPNIVGFHDWFESRDKFYIATQLATGGELFDRIVAKGKFTEQDAAMCVKQILDALAYLHQNDIVHRDIKPENVLYLRSEQEDPKSPIVLADFGIAKKLRSKDQVLKTAAGSFGYAAPEVLMGIGHGKPCDVWSTGVITYTLLCGYSPFRSETVSNFLEEVRNDNGVVFHHKYWKNISDDAKHFIMSMLKVDQNQRPSAEELLQSKWITENDNSKVDLLPNIREGFNAKGKFIQAIEVVRLKNRIKALRDSVSTDKSSSDEEEDMDDVCYASRNEFDGEDKLDKPPASPTKSDLTLKAFQSLVLTAHKNKERVQTFAENDEGN